MNITLLGQPTPQARPRTFMRGGRAVTWSPKTGQEAYILQIIKQKPPAPFVGPLQIDFQFFLDRPKSVSPRKRKYPSSKPDLDNLEKAIQDAMEGLYYKNDSQIVMKNSVKLYAQDHKEIPQTKIELREIE